MNRLTKWVNGEVWYYTKEDHYPAREMDGYDALIAMKRLAHYEDLEDQGRLMELPCKVGDIVWIIRNYRGIKRAQQGTIYEMYFTKEMKLMITVKYIGRGEFGKTVFTNKEEAEAKLAEIEGE